MLPTENRASINVEVSSNADKAFRELLSGLTDLDRQAKTLSASFATQAAANQAANDRAKELHKLAVDVGTGMREVATTVGIAAVAIGTTFVLAVKSVSDYGSKINDLALKAGSSTTKIQELTYAAVQNGVSIDTAVAAVARLSKALVEDPKSADKALRTLGLSLDELRRLDPVEQFVAIGDAIGKIPNPSQQAALSMELLGKGGAEMLKLFRSGLSETMQKAEELGLVLSEKDIRAIDDMGDSFGALRLSGEVALAKALIPMVPALTDLANGLVKVAGFVGTVAGGFQYALPAALGYSVAAMDGWATKVLTSVLKIYTVTGGNLGPFAFLGGGIENVAGIIADLGREETAMRALADEQLRLYIGAQTVTDQTKKEVAAFRDLGGAIDEVDDAMRRIRASQDALYTARFWATWGMGMETNATGAGYGYGTTNKKTGLMQGLLGLPGVGYEQAPLAPLQLKDWAEAIGDIDYSTKRWTDSLGELATALSRLGQVSGGGGFGGTVLALANILGGMELGAGVGKTLIGNPMSGKVGISNVIAGGLQGILAMQQSTSSDSTLMNILGGAGTGAAIGGNPGLMAATGGLSLAVGAVAGGIYGAIASLFKPSAQEQADAKANEQIGNAKAQLLQAYGSLDAIATLSKQLGVDLAGAWGDQGQAGLSHFNYLIGEFNKGLERNQKLIADLAAMQPGQLMAQSVAQVIQGGHLTEDSRKAIGSYITGQTANLAGYVTSYLASGASLQGGVGTGMVGAATGAIGQMLQNGQSWSDVAKTFGASIYALQAGTGQSNPLLDMVNWAGKDTVAPILDAATGIGNIASTMQNLSLLDQKTFSNLTTGLSDSYKKLTEQGVEGNSALRLMQPSLQKIWEISDRTKMTVDQATQDLMDQALANGIIGDQYKSSNDQLKDAIDRLIGSIDSLAGVFSGTGDVSGDGGVDSGYAGGGAGSGGPWDDWNYRGGQPVPSFADGTDGYRYFGGGTLALLHDWEAVTPLRKAGASGSGGRPLHVHVMVGRREIAQAVFEELPYVMQGHGVLQ